MEIIKEKGVLRATPNGKITMWTKERTSQLIELYKNNECLWNCWHKSYKNKEKRAKAIHEICSIIKITKFEFGKKIHNLRNQFNSEMKKLKHRIEESGGNITDNNIALRCKWGHFESLLFLKDIIEPRPGSNGSIMPKAKRLRLDSQDNDDDDDDVDDEDDDDCVPIKTNIDDDNTSSICPYNIDTESEEGNIMCAIRTRDQDQDQNDNGMDNRMSKQSEESEMDIVKFSPKCGIINNYTLTKTTKSNCTKTPEIVQSHSIYNIRSNDTSSSAVLQPVTTQAPTIVTTNRTIIDGDQWDAFGDLVALELRNLNSDVSRKKLKRKIMRAILDIGEEDDKYV